MASSKYFLTKDSEWAVISALDENADYLLGLSLFVVLEDPEEDDPWVVGHRCSSNSTPTRSKVTHWFTSFRPDRAPRTWGGHTPCPLYPLPRSIVKKAVEQVIPLIEIWGEVPVELALILKGAR